MQEWQTWGLSCHCHLFSILGGDSCGHLLAADDISHAELSITLSKYHFNFTQ